MKFADIPKFDSDLFTKEELASFQTFMNQCTSANSKTTIEKSGAELDARRAAHRNEMRRLAQRSYSITAFYKALIQEVPRRFNKAVVK